MKGFIRKSILISLPFIFYFIFESLLPHSLFTFRPWEALSYNSIFSCGRPFYPNQFLSMISVGDLCHNTGYEIFRKEVWKTDKLGFRNDTFIYDPDILIIGDSFIAGSGLTQNHTITNQLNAKSNNSLKAYNIAPASFSDFKFLLDNQIIKKPKFVVFAKVERTIPQLIYNQRGRLKKISYKYQLFSRLTILIDKGLRCYLQNWVISKIKGTKGKGKKGIGNLEIFFLYGKNQIYNYNKIDQYCKTIRSYNEYCTNQDITFIFLPIANKETIYYEYVPFAEQPQFINILCSKLRGLNIKVLNTQEVFTNFINNDNELLYQLDDTHWNHKGVNLISNQLINIIK